MSVKIKALCDHFSVEETRNIWKELYETTCKLPPGYTLTRTCKKCGAKIETQS